VTVTVPGAGAGIASFGAYVPMARLPLGHGGSESEKAVAWHDEDAITMAVAASIDCLAGIDRASVDAVLFASTTHPFHEKQAAALIARALDLRRDVTTLDCASSLRAGVTALRAALDAVRAGSARAVLVVASDARMAPPGSALEQRLGDGAAAFLVAADGAIAVVDTACSIADEIFDVWRAEGDSQLRSWEDRFIAKHGARESLAEVIAALATKTGVAPRDFDRAILYALDGRDHAELVRSLRLDPARAQDPLFGRLGNTGTAFVPMLLAAGLESAQPGERLLVAAYGDGAEALALRTTDRVRAPSGRRGVGGHLARRRAADPRAYWRARKEPKPAGAGISATKHWRERDEDVSFKGRVCRGCGTIHFPVQRVCIRCMRKDDFEPVRLSDRRATLVSHTVDSFHPTPMPPTLAGVVEIDGGCRVYLQITDARPDELRLGLEVELTFRKIHDADRMPNYYWKCTPVRPPT